MVDIIGREMPVWLDDNQKKPFDRRECLEKVERRLCHDSQSLASGPSAAKVRSPTRSGKSRHCTPNLDSVLNSRLSLA